jgi:hypothetical protein
VQSFTKLAIPPLALTCQGGCKVSHLMHGRDKDETPKDG